MGWAWGYEVPCATPANTVAVVPNPGSWEVSGPSHALDSCLSVLCHLADEETEASREETPLLA